MSNIRTCRHPGCKISWPVANGPGRPRVWCDEHGTTMHATRRLRSEPRSAKPPCCPVRGKCPQHKQAPKSYVRNSAATWGRNGQTLSDFVDVFGYAQILSDSGHPVYTWLPMGA